MLDLHNTPFAGKKISFLAGDASLRRYYRIIDGEHSKICMDASLQSLADVKQFLHVTALLENAGLKVPKIYYANLEKKMLVLEDFGEGKYSALLRQTTDHWPLYQKALDALILIQLKFQHRPVGIMDFDVDFLLQKLEAFPKHTGFKHPKFWDTCAKLAQYAMNSPKTLVLMDYHVDNLFLNDKQCALLDYQDAMWGPVFYDLMALIEDARIRLSDDLQNKMWNYFYTECRPYFDLNSLRKQADILVILRHLRVIGVFSKLGNEGQPSYLRHLPRLRLYLRRKMQAYPVFAELLKDYVG